MDIALRDGRIAAFLERDADSSVADDVIDAGGLHVLPGVIDPHTHIGLGGELDWQTESAMAARGGVTTLFNYVIGGSSYFELVAAEHEAAERLSHVDYALHVVPCTQEHLGELDQYIDELGITSFKFFMNFRGQEGAYLGVEGTDDSYLYEYLRKVSQRPGAIANIHTENIEIVWKLREDVRNSGLGGLAAWDACRPDFTEAEAVGRVGFFSTLVGAPLYVVHLSAASCLREAELARTRSKEQAPIYVETCPHYLTHTVDSPVGSLGKVNPPLRHRDDVEALWEGLKNGLIQTVGSDHVARQRARKETDIWTATAGISGTGAILTSLLSEGVHKRGLPLEKVVEVTSTNAARIFGLLPRKGTIGIGSDADLVLVDLEEERTVDADTWGGGAEYNLYEGWEMKGWPTLTMLRGQVLYRDGDAVATPGFGEYLHRSAKGGHVAERIGG